LITKRASVNDNLRSGDGESGPSSLLAGKKIIFVFTVLELGGAERQALLLAKYLVEQCDANVEFWGLEGTPGRLAEICEERGIPWRIVYLPWWENRGARVKGLLRLAQTLREARPYIIAPYLITPNVACGLVWPWTGARLCIWNQRDNGIARLGPRFEQWAVQRTPWFIANSKHGANFLTDTLNAPASRVRVVHNGITLGPPQSDRPTWREQLGIDEDCFATCMIANLTRYKDHATLLKAWRRVVDQLAEKGRTAVLLLAGRLDSSDSTQHETKAMAYDLGLGSTVRFLGPTNDISGLLNMCDLGVFSSRSESSPNGVLECMAAGLAIAGTDESGIRDAVGTDGRFFLAPAGEAEPLADRILQLATNLELRTQLGTANRIRIEREFSPQGMSEQTIDVIREALNGRIAQRQPASIHSENAF
jgi:glycosyltransferase involved in cell wall biosynthesis